MNNAGSPHRAHHCGSGRWRLLQRGILLLLALFVASGSLAEASERVDMVTREDGLPSGAVTSLAWEGGALWIGTIAGLGRWEEGRVTTVELPLPEHHILALYADGRSLWVGTIKGLGRLENGIWQQWDRGDSGLRSSWITALTSHQGETVLGSFGGGVQVWRGEAWVPVGEPPAQVTALASDGTRLWAATPRGLWKWDGISWTREEALPEGVSGFSVLSVSENALWAGSHGGLLRRSREESAAWESTGVSERVTALADAGGGVIAATIDGNLVRLQEDATVALSLDEAPLPYVSALMVTDEQLFVGTMGQGVHVVGATVPPPPSSPLPVMLVHGLGDSNNVYDSNMRFLATWLQQDGHEVSYFAYNEEAPLLENVARLREAIAALRARTGSEKLLIVAHSFGGLLARHYTAGGAPEIAGVITLGTPHAGARLAYDFLVADMVAGVATASTFTLLPEYADLVAPYLGQSIPYLQIGGELLPDGNLFEGFPPHDGIVTAASAVAGAGERRLFPLLHGWTERTMELGVETMLWPETLYLNVLRPWIQQRSRGEHHAPADTGPPALPAPGFSSHVLVDEVLPAGHTGTATITLGEQPATWLLSGEHVAMDLIGPDGERFHSNRVILGESVAHLPYRENVLQPLDLWSTRGQGGTWTAELRNTGERDIHTRLTVVEPSAPGLSVDLSEPWLSAGEEVTLRARGAPSQNISARLGATTYPLAEIALGEYEGVVVAPHDAGYHPITVSDGTIERSTILGVRSEAWRISQVEIVGQREEQRLDLTVEGEGRAALGIRLLKGDEVVSAQLIGPFRFRFPGTHHLRYSLPALPEPGDYRLEWQLFDSTRALVPVGGRGALPIRWNP